MTGTRLAWALARMDANCSWPSLTTPNSFFGSFSNFPSSPPMWGTILSRISMEETPG